MKSLLIGIFRFVFLSVRKSFSSKELKYLNWIEPGMKLKFVSSDLDDVIYEFNNFKHSYRKCKNWPVSCLSDTYARTYYYKKITNDSSYKYEFGAVKKSRNKTDIYLTFEGTLHVINHSKNLILNSFSYNGLLLDDVYINEVAKHDASLTSDEVLSKIWMSLSKGVLKYETGNGKVWIRK